MVSCEIQEAVVDIVNTLIPFNDIQRNNILNLVNLTIKNLQYSLQEQKMDEFTEKEYKKVRVENEIIGKDGI